MRSLQEFIAAATVFISNVLLPLLFALALLFFIYNAFRFFVAGSNQQESRDSAKRLALYGIGAFVLLVSIWGLVNLLVSGLNLGSNNYVSPDYFRGTADNQWWFQDSTDF